MLLGGTFKKEKMICTYFKIKSRMEQDPQEAGYIYCYQTNERNTYKIGMTKLDEDNLLKRRYKTYYPMGKFLYLLPVYNRCKAEKTLLHNLARYRYKKSEVLHRIEKHTIKKAFKIIEKKFPPFNSYITELSVEQLTQYNYITRKNYRNSKFIH